MNHVVTAPAVSIVGGGTFAVHRIYCVGRNYAEHAREMGHSGREAPFFFMKPADAVVTGPTMRYPSQTADLHHEVELVVAIAKGGRDIPVGQALAHVGGYAVGLDMTRRDLQSQAKKQGRPWCAAKGFDASAPIGPITPAARVPSIGTAAIELRVNGQVRQHSTIDRMIWNVAEVVSHLSALWALQPGDLIYSGTPEGVAATVAGDVLEARVDGLEPLRITIAEA